MAQNGEDYVDGHIYSYQDANEDKNHNYGAALPANRQNGMLSVLSTGRAYLRINGVDIEIPIATAPYAPANLIRNSLLGVWSLSDTNKGLGAMAYDAGAIAPVVGETLTGATSGASGKVIYYTITGGSFGAGTAAGIIYLGSCAGRFNDNESITGSVGGAGMLNVNRPDAGRGVDLLRNGEFQASVNGWTATNCALASVAGGLVGNCLQMTRTGAATQEARSDAITVEGGKIYKIRVSVLTGTSGNEQFNVLVWDITNAAWIGNPLFGGTTSGVWTGYERCFEAPVNCVSIYVYLQKATATAGTMLFDEDQVYEIAPSCTAADQSACDK